MIRLRQTLTALLALPAATAACAQDHHMHDGMAMDMPMDMPMPASDANPQGEPPAPPADHAAERYHSAQEMNAARSLLLHENGGMPSSMIRLDRFEYRSAHGADLYHWEGGGYFGGDIDRFAFKTEGDGEHGGKIERAELQALYSHAIAPYFNLQAGLRRDVQSGPRRSYATVGVDGIAPYWFDVGAELFVSNKGDVHMRIEASYDLRITQRLILQPQTELNFAAQDVPELRVGSGLSNIEMGLRLRYEIAREFAPYVGFAWDRKTGDTADYARTASERRSSAGLVAGIRLWF